MNTYDLSKNWFDFCFENPEKISPTHTAIYFFAIEHCNRLGGKEKFGFPSQMTMDAIGIKKPHTYIKYFNDIVDWGFFKLIQKSQNQYSSNIISLHYAKPKNGTALGKANAKHTAEHGHSTRQGTGSIIKPIKPIKPLNKEEENIFDFRNELLKLGIEEKIVTDWLKVRKNKKATNTETALNGLISKFNKSGMTPNECAKIAVEKSWSGFDINWLKEKYESNRGYTKNGFNSPETRDAIESIELQFAEVEQARISSQTFSDRN